jgi:hypothetical protein
MNPGRDAPDRSYHQTADSRWTRRRTVDCVLDAMKFHSTSRASRGRVLLLMRPLPKVEQICVFPMVSKEEQEFIESSI